jgi:hypothetical protein
MCDWCSLTFRCNVRDDEVMCLRCDRMARRVWGFHVLPTSGSGYNPATGSYVLSKADLKSRLARASEEASAPRTVYDGYGEAHEIERPPSNYVPVDLRDREALGVTSEGLDATYDHLRRIGNDPVADRLRKVID